MPDELRHRGILAAQVKAHDGATIMYLCDCGFAVDIGPAPEVFAVRRIELDHKWRIDARRSAARYD